VSFASRGSRLARAGAIESGAAMVALSRSARPTRWRLADAHRAQREPPSHCTSVASAC